MDHGLSHLNKEPDVAMISSSQPAAEQQVEPAAATGLHLSFVTKIQNAGRRPKEASPQRAFVLLFKIDFLKKR